jgi:hypothetical protein
LASLRNDFNKFIFDRAFIAAPQKTLANPEYQKVSDKQQELYFYIRDLIGTENLQLLLDYEATTNEENAYITEDAYRQGLLDGISLQNELGLDDIAKIFMAAV